MEKSSKDLLKRFHNNLMKSNPDKCHLLVSSCEKMKMEIGNLEMDSSTFGKLLGVHFDNRLTFDYHISRLCKKASKKLMHQQKSVNS